MLILIILSSGDAALVVNGQIIITADPQFDEPSVVEEVGEKLAAALEQPLQRIERPTPDAEDWNWDDVLEEVEVGQAFGHIPAGG